MKRIFTLFLVSVSMQVAMAHTDSLRAKITKIVQDKKADIGVAVWVLESKDTLSINGNKAYPMMSVVKFHTALTALHWVDQQKLSLTQQIHVSAADLDPNQYSPMRDEKPKEGFDLTVADLIRYAVAESDNIAFLKLVDLLGEIKVVNDYMHTLGIEQVTIVSTYRDPFLEVLKNRTSPLSANQLLKQFYKGKVLKKTTQDFLWKTMTETRTGPDRIPGLLPKGTPVAHKTGTGGWDEQRGLNSAFNDIGMVVLPNGQHLIVAVFMGDSKETDVVNARTIAEITKAAWDTFATGK